MSKFNKEMLESIRIFERFCVREVNWEYLGNDKYFKIILMCYSLVCVSIILCEIK